MNDARRVPVKRFVLEGARSPVLELAAVARLCVALIALALVATVATAAGWKLAIYVDGSLHSSADEAAVRGRPSDYKRGTLSGWRLFGALLPAAARANTQAIEVVGAGGQVLRIENPVQQYPGLEPVLFLDRRNDLRFMMV